MSLKDILNAESGSRFELTVPACNPLAPAYDQWVGMEVIKVAGAVKVLNSVGVKSIEDGDLLPLCGMVTRSVWTQYE